MVGHLGLRFARQDEKHTVPDLTDIYSEYIGSNEGEFWGDGGGVSVGDVSDIWDGYCCTDYDGCDVEEERKRGEDLETDEVEIILNCRMRSVQW